MTRTTAAGILRAALLTAALLAAPRDARAFARETADGTGKPLYWQDLPVAYAVNAACAGTMEDTRACHAAVQASFSAWSSPQCTTLTFDYLGETERTDVGYSQAQGAENANLVVWIFDQWPHDSRALALTTATYIPASGVIVDADMEVNGVNFQWRVLTAPDTRYVDIQNVVTHEAGHVIGLDHTGDASSTMYPTAPNGETSKRDLAPDDVDGVCSIYPVPGYDGGSGGGSGSGGATPPIGGKDRTGGADTYSPGGCGCAMVAVP